MDFVYLQLSQSRKLKPPFGVKLERIIQEHWCFVYKYRVIQNDCQGFNNLSYTIHLR